MDSSYSCGRNYHPVIITNGNSTEEAPSRGGGENVVAQVLTEKRSGIQKRSENLSELRTMRKLRLIQVLLFSSSLKE